MSDPLSPKSPRKGGKQVSLRVCFLDDSVHAFQVPVKALGQVLWEAVANHLQLLEADYFDLEFTDAENLQCWVDREKPILKQLPSPDTPLRFSVKFYTPDPGLLEDELTRYLFALQIKRDLLTGALPCSENTAALLASYIVQAEIGDFLIDEYHDYTYLSSMKFVPQQTPDLLTKIMEYHKQHVGESPSEADLNLLDTARKVEMYGIRMHPAKDHEGVSLNLAASHMGVLVFQNQTKINTFSWAKIRKLSFKRKKFLIKLHPENYGYYKDTVEFFFESRNECKGFWKKCIEHHAFFRCQTVKKLPRNKTRVVSRGSSFRYSGRTQKQLAEFVRDSVVKRPQFERSTSGRISSRSTSVTPKIHPKTSVHNSSDLHNSTASSGSHILEPLQDNHVDGGLGGPTRLETAEVHSDSSMSGSRSLGSPKLDHGHGSHPSESRSRSTTQTPELPLAEPANAVSAATAVVAATTTTSDAVDNNQGAGNIRDKSQQNIVSDMHLVSSSANQNANDNDDTVSQDSYHLGEDGEEGQTGVGGAKSGGGETHTTKTVTFCSVDQQDGASEVAQVTKDVGVMANGHASMPSQSPNSGGAAESAVYENLSEVPPSACITASVYGREYENVKIRTTRPGSPSADSLKGGSKAVDQTSSCAFKSGSAETHVTAQSVQTDDDPNLLKVEALSAEAGASSCVRKLSADTDLILDIPYTLHKRHDGLEETSLYTTENRPPPRPSSGEHTRSLDRPSREKAPKTARQNSDEPRRRETTPRSSSETRRSTSRGTSLERSPSGRRRIELVSFHKLPPKYSYSSIDDTTSPTLEKEILKQLETPTKTESSQVEDVNVEQIGVTREEKVESQESKPVSSEEERKTGDEPPKVVLEAPATVEVKKDEEELVTVEPDAKDAVVKPASAAEKPEEKIQEDVPVPTTPSDVPSPSPSQEEFPPPPPSEELPPPPDDFLQMTESMAEKTETAATGAPAESSLVAAEAVLSEDTRVTHQAILPEGRKRDKAPSTSSDSSTEPKSDSKDGKETDSGSPNPASSGHSSSPSLTGSDTTWNSLDGEKDPWHSTHPDHKDAQPAAQPQQPPPPPPPPTGKVPPPTAPKPPRMGPPAENRLNFDMPSPAAAFIYSDDESPPSQGSKLESTLTFSTFRPDPQDLTPTNPSPTDLSPGFKVTRVPLKDREGDSSDPKKRWSLGKVEEEGEQETEGKAKAEGKRVSFHEELDVQQQSFHSDVSMAVLRSPVEEPDDSSFYEGSSTPGEEGVDTGDVLATLDNLGHLGDSESDMTYSGSSGEEDNTDTETGPSDIMAKEIYAQYAASRCLAEAGKDATADSGVGELSEGARDPSNASPGSGQLEEAGTEPEEDKGEAEEVNETPSSPPPPPPPIPYLEPLSSSEEDEPPAAKRWSIDPLAGLEHPDVADIAYTTSESESDFEEKDNYFRRLSHVEGGPVSPNVAETESDSGTLETVEHNQ